MLIATALLYGVTCAPGYLWQDSGLIQYRVLNNDIVGFFGLAVAHPLYYLLAILVKYLIPGWFPWSINLISALAGAVTVANVYLLLRIWSGTPLPGLVGATALAVSHTFWRHACIAETYTLWSALFSVELLLFAKYQRDCKNRYLYGLALVNGLALSVHNLAVLSFLIYIGFVLVACFRRRLSWRTVPGMVGCWFVGALPILILFIREAVPSGDMVGTLASLAFGRKWQADVLNSHLTWKLVAENILYIGLNFPTPIILLAGLGVFRLVRTTRERTFGFLLLGLGVVFLAFASRYTVADRYAFFIPFYIVFALLLGIGAEKLLRKCDEHGIKTSMVVFAFIPVGVYSILPTLLNHSNVKLPTRGDVPFRDDAYYFLTPWRCGEDGPERFARGALSTVGPGAVIFADQTTLAPLLLLQQQGKLRTDVRIVSSAISTPGAPTLNEYTLGAILKDSSVYVTSRSSGYCPYFILRDYSLTKTGNLFQVLQKAESNN